MNIRLARLKDIMTINQLYKKVIEDMQLKKINIWNDIYPFCEFENDINNNRMYVVEKEDKIIGSFVLDDFEDEDFKYIKWKLNNKSSICLNRLAILPSEQGKGYAKLCMNFIEEFAKDNGYEVIKLTVYEKNVAAICLYLKLGYKKVEDGSYMIDDNIYIGYEKNIK